MKQKLLLIAAAGMALTAYSADDKTPKTPRQYVLGPNDQINVEVVELPEFNNRSYRIDPDGTVSLPLVGRVPAAGLTVAQFQDGVENALRSQVRNPHVVTGLVEVRSQPVSVMGSVNTPGTEMLQGQKTLFDVLAMAGGLKSDAGDVIKITRRRDEGPLELPSAQKDLSSGSTTGEVKVRDVVDLRNPEANILVRPYDAISVPRAQVVYVIGNVRKAGGFAFPQNRNVSVLDALSMAEGMTPNAAPKDAHIVRRISENPPRREQIPVDLRKMLAGKAEDSMLQPDDILYVPDNTTRRTTGKIMETVLSTASGLIIWRGF